MEEQEVLKSLSSEKNIAYLQPEYPNSGIPGLIRFGHLRQMMRSKVCHPKIYLFGILIILSWLFYEIKDSGRIFDAPPYLLKEIHIEKPA